jgi:hypothetical protein
MSVARAEASVASSIAWRLIILFYEAMHAVEEAVLAPQNVHPVSHPDREIKLGTLAIADPWLTDLRGDLVDMKSISFQARYWEEPSIWTDQHLHAQEAALERIYFAISNNCR